MMTIITALFGKLPPFSPMPCRSSRCVKSCRPISIPLLPPRQNPEGLLLTSTLFSSLVGDELPGMKIVAGKTGYTLEAKRCLVSMAVRDDGREYIVVVVGGEGKWTPITDSIELYARCLPAEQTLVGATTET